MTDPTHLAAPDDRAALVECDQRFFDALVAADTARLAELLADGFLLVAVNDGAVVDRAALLDAVAGGAVRFPAVRPFPDEAVVLGLHSAFVPYIDPGVALARAIRDEIAAFGRRHGGHPRVIYMQNHGVIALGRNPTEAVNISLMAAKAARIRLGALQAGGLNLLPEATAQHIVNRPDEKYREAQLVARL